jgi:hypothetical protein
MSGYPIVLLLKKTQILPSLDWVIDGEKSKFSSKVNWISDDHETA